jgi:predicted dehydrogenase
MADSVGAAADMLMVCRRNGVKLAIGHQRRFLPA